MTTCSRHGQQIAHVGNLLFKEKDVGVFKVGDHALMIGHKVGREIAAVKLHTLDNIEFGFQTLGFFNRDDAVFADLFHRPRQ